VSFARAKRTASLISTVLEAQVVKLFNDEFHFERHAAGRSYSVKR
jgi:hypothetical protein